MPDIQIENDDEYSKREDVNTNPQTSTFLDQSTGQEPLIDSVSAKYVMELADKVDFGDPQEPILELPDDIEELVKSISTINPDSVDFNDLKELDRVEIKLSELQIEDAMLSSSTRAEITTKQAELRELKQQILTNIESRTVQLHTENKQLKSQMERAKDETERLKEILDKLISEEPSLVSAGNRVLATVEKINEELNLNVTSVGVGQLKHEDRQMLSESMKATYNIEEVKDISFDIGVDFEDFASNHDTKGTVVRKFIEHCERTNMTSALINSVKNTRPNIADTSTEIEVSSGDSRKKFQLTIKGLQNIELTYLKSYLSGKIGIAKTDIAVLALAYGSIRVIVSVPDTSMQDLATLEGATDFRKNAETEISIRPYEELDDDVQNAWRKIYRSHLNRSFKIYKPIFQLSDYIDPSSD